MSTPELRGRSQPSPGIALARQVARIAEEWGNVQHVVPAAQRGIWSRWRRRITPTMSSASEKKKV